MKKEIEDRLISSIRNSEDLSEVLLADITSDMFPFRKEVFEFVTTYSSQYNSIPSKELIETTFTDFDTVEEVPDSERNFLIGEIKKYAAQRSAMRVLNSGSDMLAKDVYGSIDYIVNGLNAVKKGGGKYTISHTDRDALKRYDEYKKRCAKNAKGEILGICTGLSVFDKDGVGFLRGQLVTLVARTSVGKSWLGTYMGASAYHSGKRVLYISPEMPTEEVELRWDVILARMNEIALSNEALTRGKAQPDYKKWLTKAAKRDDWITVDTIQGKPLSIKAVQGLIDECNPDIVFIDGFLMIEGSKIWDALIEQAAALKDLALKNKIVVVVSTQANKTAHGEMPESKDMYGGEALSHASDVVITMQEKLTDGKLVRQISIQKRRGMHFKTDSVKINFEVDKGNIGS